MEADQAAQLAADEADQAATAAYHAVLLSPDLFGELFPSLDTASKVALRGVNRAMRSQVDASIEIVASPASGLSPDSLTHALSTWPAVRDLTLLAVRYTSDLVPLATTSVAGLTSLTVRQVGCTRMGAWHRMHGTPMLRMHATHPSHTCSSRIEPWRVPAPCLLTRDRVHAGPTT